MIFLLCPVSRSETVLSFDMRTVMALYQRSEISFPWSVGLDSQEKRKRPEVGFWRCKLGLRPSDGLGFLTGTDTAIQISKFSSTTESCQRSNTLNCIIWPPLSFRSTYSRTGWLSTVTLPVRIMLRSLYIYEKRTDGKQETRLTGHCDIGQCQWSILFS